MQVLFYVIKVLSLSCRHSPGCHLHLMSTDGYAVKIMWSDYSEFLGKNRQKQPKVVRFWPKKAKKSYLGLSQILAMQIVQVFCLHGMYFLIIWHFVP